MVQSVDTTRRGEISPWWNIPWKNDGFFRYFKMIQPSKLVSSSYLTDEEWLDSTIKNGRDLTISSHFEAWIRVCLKVGHTHGVVSKVGTPCHPMVHHNVSHFWIAISWVILRKKRQRHLMYGFLMFMYIFTYISWFVKSEHLDVVFF